MKTFKMKLIVSMMVLGMVAGDAYAGRATLQNGSTSIQVESAEEQAPGSGFIDISVSATVCAVNLGSFVNIGGNYLSWFYNGITQIQALQPVTALNKNVSSVQGVGPFEVNSISIDPQGNDCATGVAQLKVKNVGPVVQPAPAAAPSSAQVLEQ